MFRKTIASVLFLCVLPLFAACGAKNEIAGCWKAELSVLGLTEGVSTAPEDNYILLYFNEDLEREECSRPGWAERRRNALQLFPFRRPDYYNPRRWPVLCF